MRSKQQALFAEEKTTARRAPLADRLRPQSWKTVVGLEGIDAGLRAVLERGEGVPPSLVLWGPPGSGKTTVARLLGKTFDVEFVEFSAVLQGVKEVREVVEQATYSHKPTVLFVDEIHRFNKGQQDAFLPHVESGRIVLIGATTENPSFYLTQALLSRVRVVVLQPHSEETLAKLVLSAAQEIGVKVESDAAQLLVKSSGGDARRLLRTLEDIQSATRRAVITAQDITAQVGAPSFYDRSGDEHYQMASAFIKSMRGSDPDAALAWAFKMIEGGEDPRFIIRRLMIFASEDIGNADPRALPLAVATAEAFDRLGMPEGRIAIGQCVTYLATAPKSNRSYVALGKAQEAARTHSRFTVPKHLRPAPTKLMEELGHGAGYQYPHDQGGYVVGVSYSPEELKGVKWYEPADAGYELKIKQLMDGRKR